MYLGPVIGIDSRSLPIRLSGGCAVDIWQDSLPDVMSIKDLVDVNSDIGLYGDIRVGNNTTPLFPGFPLFAEGSIFGKYMNNNIL